MQRSGKRDGASLVSLNVVRCTCFQADCTLFKAALHPSQESLTASFELSQLSRELFNTYAVQTVCKRVSKITRLVGAILGGKA